MLGYGPAKKVIVHVGEDHIHRGQAAFKAILEYLSYRGVAVASAIRGIAGLGADHPMPTVAIEPLAENRPIQIEFIEAPEKVEEVMPKLREMAGSGWIEVQSTFVLPPSKPSRSSRRRDFDRCSNATTGRD